MQNTYKTVGYNKRENNSAPKSMAVVEQRVGAVFHALYGSLFRNGAPISHPAESFWDRFLIIVICR